MRWGRLSTRSGASLQNSMIQQGLPQRGILRARVEPDAEERRAESWIGNLAALNAVVEKGGLVVRCAECDDLVAFFHRGHDLLQLPAPCLPLRRCADCKPIHLVHPGVGELVARYRTVGFEI